MTEGSRDAGLPSCVVDSMHSSIEASCIMLVTRALPGTSPTILIGSPRPTALKI